MVWWLGLLPLVAWLLMSVAWAASRHSVARDAWLVAPVLAFVVWCGLATASAQLLDVAGAIQPVAFRAFWGGVVGLLAAVVWRLRRSVPTVSLRALWALAPLPVAATALFTVGVLAVGLATPPTNWDSMTYHLPRLEHWLANGSTTPYPTHCLRQASLLPGGEYLTLAFRATAGGADWVVFPQLMAYLVFGALLALLARAVGLPSRAQVLAAALGLTLPTALLQATSTFNDLVMAALCLSAGYGTVRLTATGSYRWALWAGLAAGLAVGVKPLAVCFLLPLGLVALVYAPGRVAAARWLGPAALAVCVALLPVAYPMAQLQAAFGHPLGSPTLRSWGANDQPSAAATASNTARNLVHHLTLPGTGAAGWNAAVRAPVLGLHRVLALNPDDPATSYANTRFSDHAAGLDEGLVASQLHYLALLGVGLAAAVALLRRRRVPRGMWLWGAGMLGVLLLSALVKWQPWGARFLLVALGLGLVPVAGALARWPRKAATVVFAAVAVFSLWVFLKQTPRRVLAHEGSVFATAPHKLLFAANVSLYTAYTAITDTLAFHKPTHVGLVAEEDSWEYPLWWLAQVRGHSLRIHAWHPTGQLAYPGVGAPPLPPTWLIDLTGQPLVGYRVVYASAEARLYRRVPPAH